MAGEELSLTIGELAAMVGVSTDTIRAWERRHGVLAPGRTSARHRRYGMEDVETLRRVRHNVALRGLSLKLAVAEAHGLVLEEVYTPPDQERPVEAANAIDEGTWRAVGDLLPSLLCILDRRGKVIDANMAFARMAGVLRPRLRGIPFLDVVEPADRAKAARLFRPPQQHRRGWELNLRSPMLTGLFTFDSYVVPTMTSAFIVLVGRDLSASGIELWPQTGPNADDVTSADEEHGR